LDVTLCGLVDVSDISGIRTASILTDWRDIMKMEDASRSETPVTFYRTKRSQINHINRRKTCKIVIN
jgi:hypothetical protein